MRITIQEDANSVTMKVEGRIARHTMPEFSRAWHSLAPSLGSRRLSIDLRNVTFVDGDGQQILREIYEKKRPDFLTSTPLTQYFAEEAMRVSTTDGPPSKGGK